MGIDATKAMQLAKKFIDAKGNNDTVKGVQDTISKVEKEMKKKPGAQDWARVLMIRDPTLDKAIAGRVSARDQRSDLSCEIQGGLAQRLYRKTDR